MTMLFGGVFSVVLYWWELRSPKVRPWHLRASMVLGLAVVGMRAL